MDETTYHQLADATLDALEHALEPAYDSGALDDLLRDGSVLSITLASGQTLVVSKHAPTQQIWLASTRLGGLHFERRDEDWQLADGRRLHATLQTALAEGGVEVAL